MIPTPPPLLQIEAQQVQGPGVAMRQISVQVSASRPQTLHWSGRGQLQPSPNSPWQQLQAQGHIVQEQGGAYGLAGQLQIQQTPLGNLWGKWQGKISQYQGNAKLHAQIQGSLIGHWQIHWNSGKNGNWQAQAQGALPLSLLGKAGWLPASWHPDGTLQSVLWTAGQRWQQLDRLRFQGRLLGLSFNSPDGLQAAQQGSLAIRGGARPGAGGWQGQVELHWQGGQVLWSPWYLQSPSPGVSLQVHWQWQQGRWAVRQGTIHWPQMGIAHFTAILPRHGSPGFTLTDAHLQLGPLYHTLLRPLFPGNSLLHRLETNGQLLLSASYAQGLQHIHWQLRHANLHDPRGQLILTDIQSQGYWSLHGANPPTQLDWLWGKFYGIPFGPLSASFRNLPGQSQLRQPVTLSTLGGKIQLERLRASWSHGQPQFLLGAQLEDLQLGALTRNFGWPPFAGSLSASIPAIQYHQGDLRTDGQLLARAFGGQIQITGLAIRGLFGTSPLLTANVTLHDLQLKPLTQVFPVGYISGVLDGQIQDLTLLNWQPIAFRAQLATHPQPGVPQEISAAAIQKLTRLGGGVSSFFQNIFLGYFRNFAYAKLGIGIRLRDGVAELSGVGSTAHGGFVLLQGKGLPRVNIVGYNHRVDWQELLARLHAAIQGQTQVSTGEGK
ncbi:MAG: hypothetical protein K0041_03690 [Acidithiobacillus sp.]|nr:hypothetical protein [Acidithiobacillus sp.]